MRDNAARICAIYQCDSVSKLHLLFQSGRCMQACLIWTRYAVVLHFGIKVSGSLRLHVEVVG